MRAFYRNFSLYVNSALPMSPVLGLRLRHYLEIWGILSMVVWLILGQTSPTVPWLIQWLAAFRITAPFVLGYSLVQEAWGHYAERTVGHQWLISMGGFVLGYWVLWRGYGQLFLWYRESPWNELLQILPFWFGITVILIQWRLRGELQWQEQQRVQHNQRLLEHSVAPLKWHPHEPHLLEPNLLGSPISPDSSSTAIVPHVETTSVPQLSSSPVDRATMRQDSATQRPANFVVHATDGLVVLPPQDISHISVEEHYSQIWTHTPQGVIPIQARLSLKEALKQLPTHEFVQIHRSYLVSLHHVLQVDKEGTSHYVVLRHSVERLPISRRRTSQVLLKLETFLTRQKQPQ